MGDIFDDANKQKQGKEKKCILRAMLKNIVLQNILHFYTIVGKQLVSISLFACLFKDPKLQSRPHLRAQREFQKAIDPHPSPSN